MTEFLPILINFLKEGNVDQIMTAILNPLFEDGIGDTTLINTIKENPDILNDSSFIENFIKYLVKRMESNKSEEFKEFIRNTSELARKTYRQIITSVRPNFDSFRERLQDIYYFALYPPQKPKLIMLETSYKSRNNSFEKQYLEIKCYPKSSIDPTEKRRKYYDLENNERMIDYKFIIEVPENTNVEFYKDAILSALNFEYVKGSELTYNPETPNLYLLDLTPYFRRIRDYYNSYVTSISIEQNVGLAFFEDREVLLVPLFFKLAFTNENFGDPSFINRFAFSMDIEVKISQQDLNQYSKFMNRITSVFQISDRRNNKIPTQKFFLKNQIAKGMSYWEKKDYILNFFSQLLEERLLSVSYPSGWRTKEFSIANNNGDFGNNSPKVSIIFYKSKTFDEKIYAGIANTINGNIENFRRTIEESEPIFPFNYLLNIYNNDNGDRSYSVVPYSMFFMDPRKGIQVENKGKLVDYPTSYYYSNYVFDEVVPYSDIIITDVKNNLTALNCFVVESKDGSEPILSSNSKHPIDIRPSSSGINWVYLMRVQDGVPIFSNEVTISLFQDIVRNEEENTYSNVYVVLPLYSNSLMVTPANTARFQIEAIQFVKILREAAMNLMVRETITFETFISRNYDKIVKFFGSKDETDIFIELFLSSISKYIKSEQILLFDSEIVRDFKIEAQKFYNSIVTNVLNSEEEIPNRNIEKDIIEELSNSNLTESNIINTSIAKKLKNQISLIDGLIGKEITLDTILEISSLIDFELLNILISIILENINKPISFSDIENELARNNISNYKILEHGSFYVCSNRIENFQSNIIELKEFSLEKKVKNVLGNELIHAFFNVKISKGTKFNEVLNLIRKCIHYENVLLSEIFEIEDDDIEIDRQYEDENFLYYDMHCLFVNNGNLLVSKFLNFTEGNFSFVLKTKSGYIIADKGIEKRKVESFYYNEDTQKNEPIEEEVEVLTKNQGILNLISTSVIEADLNFANSLIVGYDVIDLSSDDTKFTIFTNLSCVRNVKKLKIIPTSVFSIYSILKDLNMLGKNKNQVVKLLNLNILDFIDFSLEELRSSMSQRSIYIDDNSYVTISTVKSENGTIETEKSETKVDYLDLDIGEVPTYSYENEYGKKEEELEKIDRRIYSSYKKYLHEKQKLEKKREEISLNAVRYALSVSAKVKVEKETKRLYNAQEVYWTKYSDDKLIYAVGFANHVLIYLFIIDKFFHVSTLFHESVSDIILGNSLYCVTVSEVSSFLWIYQTGVKVDLFIPPCEFSIGDKIKGILENKTIEEEITITKVLYKTDKGVEADPKAERDFLFYQIYKPYYYSRNEFIKSIFSGLNFRTFFFSKDDRYLIYNNGQSFKLYDTLKFQELKINRYNGINIDENSNENINEDKDGKDGKKESKKKQVEKPKSRQPKFSTYKGEKAEELKGGNAKINMGSEENNNIGIPVSGVWTENNVFVGALANGSKIIIKPREIVNRKEFNTVSVIDVSIDVPVENVPVSLDNGSIVQSDKAEFYHLISELCETFFQFFWVYDALVFVNDKEEYFEYYVFCNDFKFSITFVKIGYDERVQGNNIIVREEDILFAVNYDSYVIFFLENFYPVFNENNLDNNLTIEIIGCNYPISYLGDEVEKPLIEMEKSTLYIQGDEKNIITHNYANYSEGQEIFSNTIISLKGIFKEANFIVNGKISPVYDSLLNMILMVKYNSETGKFGYVPLSSHMEYISNKENNLVSSKIKIENKVTNKVGIFAYNSIERVKYEEMNFGVAKSIKSGIDNYKISKFQHLGRFQNYSYGINENKGVTRGNLILRVENNKLIIEPKYIYIGKDDKQFIYWVIKKHSKMTEDQILSEIRKIDDYRQKIQEIFPFLLYNCKPKILDKYGEYANYDYFLSFKNDVIEPEFKDEELKELCKVLISGKSVLDYIFDKFIEIEETSKRNAILLLQLKKEELKNKKEELKKVKKSDQGKFKSAIKELEDEIDNLEGKNVSSDGELDRFDNLLSRFSNLIPDFPLPNKRIYKIIRDFSNFKMKNKNASVDDLFSHGYDNISPQDLELFSELRYFFRNENGYSDIFADSFISYRSIKNIFKDLDKIQASLYEMLNKESNYEKYGNKSLNKLKFDLKRYFVKYFSMSGEIFKIFDEPALKVALSAQVEIPDIMNEEEAYEEYYKFKKLLENNLHLDGGLTISAAKFNNNYSTNLLKEIVEELSEKRRKILLGEIKRDDFTTLNAREERYNELLEDLSIEIRKFFGNSRENDEDFLRQLLNKDPKDFIKGMKELANSKIILNSGDNSIRGLFKKMFFGNLTKRDIPFDYEYVINTFFDSSEENNFEELGDNIGDNIVERIDFLNNELEDKIAEIVKFTRNESLIKSINDFENKFSLENAVIDICQDDLIPFDSKIDYLENICSFNFRKIGNSGKYISGVGIKESNNLISKMEDDDAEKFSRVENIKDDIDRNKNEVQIPKYLKIYNYDNYYIAHYKRYFVIKSKQLSLFILEIIKGLSEPFNFKDLKDFLNLEIVKSATLSSTILKDSNGGEVNVYDNFILHNVLTSIYKLIVEIEKRELYEDGMSEMKYEEFIEFLTEICLEVYCDPLEVTKGEKAYVNTIQSKILEKMPPELEKNFDNLKKIIGNKKTYKDLIFEELETSVFCSVFRKLETLSFINDNLLDSKFWNNIQFKDEKMDGIARELGKGSKDKLNDYFIKRLENAISNNKFTEKNNNYLAIFIDSYKTLKESGISDEILSNWNNIDLNSGDKNIQELRNSFPEYNLLIEIKNQLYRIIGEEFNTNYLSLDTLINMFCNKVNLSKDVRKLLAEKSKIYNDLLWYKNNGTNPNAENRKLYQDFHVESLKHRIEKLDYEINSKQYLIEDENSQELKSNVQQRLLDVLWKYRNTSVDITNFAVINRITFEFPSNIEILSKDLDSEFEDISIRFISDEENLKLSKMNELTINIAEILNQSASRHNIVTAYDKFTSEKKKFENYPTAEFAKVDKSKYIKLKQYYDMNLQNISDEDFKEDFKQVIFSYNKVESDNVVVTEYEGFQFGKENFNKIVAILSENIDNKEMTIYNNLPEFDYEGLTRLDEIRTFDKIIKVKDKMNQVKICKVIAPKIQREINTKQASFKNQIKESLENTMISLQDVLTGRRTIYLGPVKNTKKIEEKEIETLINNSQTKEYKDKPINYKIENSKVIKLRNKEEIVVLISHYKDESRKGTILNINQETKNTRVLVFKNLIIEDVSIEKGNLLILGYSINNREFQIRCGIVSLNYERDYIINNFEYEYKLNFSLNEINLIKLTKTKIKTIAVSGIKDKKPVNFIAILGENIIVKRFKDTINDITSSAYGKNFTVVFKNKSKIYDYVGNLIKDVNGEAFII